MALVTCPDCGRQVSDRAVSCPGCGFPIAEEFGNAVRTALSTPAPAANPNSAQLAKTDREIILLHLKDLRALELVKYNFESKLTKIADRYNLPRPKRLVDLKMSIINRVFDAAQAVIPLQYQMTPLQIQNELRRQGLTFPFMMAEVDGKKVSVLSSICHDGVVPENINAAIDAAIGPGLETVDEDIMRAKIALKKAYEPNIIPAQFRDVYPIYYLYDYLSTSQESLSDALLHLDLDLIKQKLDVVIAQQCVSIIQQAITNAKLGNIENQLDTLIDTAKSIEANTADIARYSQISAAHLETIKYLQFIKL